MMKKYFFTILLTIGTLFIVNHATIAHAAIAFDNANSPPVRISATTTSYSFKVSTGLTNPYLVVCAGSTNNLATATITYASQPMTLVKEVVWFFAQGYDAIYVLPNPANGTNTIAINGNKLAVIESAAASYSGVAETTSTDGIASTTGSGTSLTLNLTTTADNDWMVSCPFVGGTGVLSAGGGTTLRSGATTSSIMGLFDSNGPITPAGSTSQTINIAPAEQYGAVMIALTPATTPPPTNAVTTDCLYFSSD